MPLAKLYLVAALLETIALAQPADPARVDVYGDPLPPRALARLGTVRFRNGTLGATFLPDSKTVVAATEQNAIHFWDARTGRRLRQIDTGTNIQRCVVSRDRTRIAISGWLRDAAGGNRTIARVYDTTAGKEVRTFDRDARDSRHAFALSPDGKLLLSLNSDGTVRIEEIATGVELLRQQFPRDTMGQVAISPDGTTVAVGTGPNSRRLYLWKWQTADEPRQLPAPDSPGGSLAFSPDGKTLAECGDHNATVRLWDVERGQIIHRLELPDQEPYWHHWLGFSPDGKTIAAAGSHNEVSGVHLWEATTGKFQQRLAIDAGPLAFSPDGKLLVAGQRSWDLAAGKELSVNDHAHRDAVSVIAAGKDIIATGAYDYMVRIWDAASGKHRRVLTHKHRVTDIALSPDGTRLASTDDDVVGLWDIATGRRIFGLPSHGRRGGLCTVGFTPDGKYLWSTGNDMYLRKWDLRNGKALLEHALRPTGVRVPTEDDDDLERMHLAMLGKKLLSPDGTRLIVPANRKFFVFDTATGKELHEFPIEGSYALSQVISPDSKLLLGSAWGQQIKTKLPDGRTRFSTADEVPVSIWDIATGKLRMQVMRRGGAGEAGPVAFSPDGKRVAAAGSHPNSPIRIWEVAGGKEVDAISVGGVVRSLAFLPDGERLVSGLEDSTALVWGVASRERQRPEDPEVRRAKSEVRKRS
jgi:WD40 repeat protein